MQPPSARRQASSATMLPCHLATLRACPQDPHEAQPRLLQGRYPARHLACPSFTRSALLLACVGQRIIRSIQPQALASSRPNRLFSPSSTQTKTHVVLCRMREHYRCGHVTLTIIGCMVESNRVLPHIRQVLRRILCLNDCVTYTHSTTKTRDCCSYPNASSFWTYPTVGTFQRMVCYPTSHLPSRPWWCCATWKTTAIQTRQPKYTKM